MMAGILVLIISGFFWSSIFQPMKKTEAVSSSEFGEHIKSVTNVTTDISNTERINRWKCAIRMFKEKPVLGWGPGTYMFQYAPFQLSKERTPISTNFGTLGNAHSEYLGPLAESGFFGFLSFFILVLLVIYKGMTLYYYGKDQKTRITALLILLGLITYFAHGLLNNFLDTDKASIPFWTMIAILTSLELYGFNKNNEMS